MMKYVKHSLCSIHCTGRSRIKRAKTAAFTLNPDVALATDVTITGDHPGIDKKDRNSRWEKALL